MKVKALDELWRKYNLKYEGKTFGQYVLENSVIQHHLDSMDQARLVHVSNIVAYNLVRLLCEDK